MDTQLLIADGVRVLFLLMTYNVLLFSHLWHIVHLIFLLMA